MKFRKTLNCLLIGASCMISSFTMSSCMFFGSDSEDAGNSIKNITTTTKSNGDTIVTIIFTDEEKSPVTFTIPKGKEGESGTGIENITQELSSDGSKVILSISFTDGSEPKVIEVPIVNGKDGVSIKNIDTKKDENGDTVVTISFEGGLDDVSFTLETGVKGETGNGIASMNITTNDDGSQTIVISYTDTSFSNTTLTIPAPEKGDTGKGISYIVSDETDDSYLITFYFSDDTTSELSFAKPEQPSTWLSGIEDPSKSEGRNGDFYLNKSTMTVYQKNNGEWNLIATLSQDHITHRVDFDANGGKFVSGFSTSFNVNHGETFYENRNYIIPKVTKDGYEFIGWHTLLDQNDITSGLFTDLTPVNSDMTLYAWWKEAA